MAAKRQARQVDYQSLNASELVWLAQVDDDKQAIDEIYARKTPVALQIARNTCRRYTFVDLDDMSQSMLLNLPKIIRTYRPGKGTDWDKYCYHRLAFTAKDILRQRDDLGICWPQKKAYPEWYRLGDESLEGFEVRDHRIQSEDMVDLERFYEEIEGWRAAFETARCAPSKTTSAANHQAHSRAWVDGRYLGVHPQPSKRKAMRPIGLSSWMVQRVQPVQLGFW